LHFPQNELARAETFEVAFANRQYHTSTNGEPLRGLIQNHVGMGLMPSRIGTFLARDEYTQMVFPALAAVTNTVGKGHNVTLLPPGHLPSAQDVDRQQVISTILIHLAGTVNPVGLFL
jgi:DNA-directed RNA polymerase I subunit RPA1